MLRVVLVDKHKHMQSKKENYVMIRKNSNNFNLGDKKCHSNIFVWVY